uniref:Uncharacterized protein n=1 Tax=Glossina palpalis gambiensis TaxID=67801 RepID=A0A1B0AYR2_9MUSC
MKCIEGKVVILGSRGVGKTRLVTKYIKSTLQNEFGPTVAPSFFTCKVMLDDYKVILQIWDTAGQERFKAVTPMYYRNANAAILVFDLSQHRTFKEIKGWIQELHSNVQGPMILTLVGNKLDLVSERAVSREEAYLFATSIGASYFEISAEMDQGLEQVFKNTAFGLMRLVNEGKCRALRQFDSSDSITKYTTSNTAYSYMMAAISSRHLHDNGGVIHLPSVPAGIPVESDEIKSNAEGRLETPSWSIEHIAWGEEVPVHWCY